MSTLTTHVSYNMDEIHIGNDYEQAKNLLETLGFIPYTRVKTFRYRFSYKDLKINLTKYSKIPVFMEIETNLTSNTSIKELLDKLELYKCTLTDHGIEQIHLKYDVDYFEVYHV